MPSPRFQKRLSRYVMRFFNLRIEGLEHLQTLPDPTRVILAGNHQGFLYGFIITAAYPHPVRFMSKAEVMSWPVVGFLLKTLANPIIVSSRQPANSLRNAARHLKQHGALCIFPEGRLSHNGALGHFYPGAAIIQRLTHEPIVPFTLSGSHRAWHWGQWLPQLSTNITIRFSPALPPTEETPQAVTNRLKALIQENLNPPESAAVIVPPHSQNPEYLLS